MSLRHAQHCKDRSSGRLWWITLLALLIGLLVIGMGLRLMSILQLRAGGPGADWLLNAMTSKWSVRCAVVLVVSVVGLVAICRGLWLVGARERMRSGGQRGAAMLEFVMVLPIALALVLIMLQAALLMGGNLCVHYSAFCAARSAIVQVPADNSPIEPPNVVADPIWSGKMHRITDAAIWALIGVSCGDSGYPQEDVTALMRGLEEFFDQYGCSTPTWVDERIGRKLRYALDHTEVDLDFPREDSEYRPREDLRVTVRHTLYLSVPYANWVFRHLSRRDGVDLDFADGEYGIVITASCTLTNEGVRNYVESEQFL